MVIEDFDGLAGLQILPSSLVWAGRAALNAQGISPAALNDNGEIDPQALIAMAFDTLEIQTTAFAPLKINLKNVSGSPSPEMQRLKPFIKLSGPAGAVELAPFGKPSGIDNAIQTAGSNIGIGIGAAILGLLFIGKALF